jgi:hypothetical protein
MDTSIKISNRMILTTVDGQAILKPSLNIHPAEVIAVLELWIQNTPGHPRCKDVQQWLDRYEEQNPPPPKLSRSR